MMFDAKDARRRADAALAEYRFAKKSAVAEREELDKLKIGLAAASEARAALQAVAHAVQESAHDELSKVVSGALRAVFGDAAYEFRLAFDRKRGRTEAKPVFSRGGHDYSPRAVGGGVVDVACLALRVACVVMSVPRPAPVLFLDEPMRMVSRNHAGRVRALVESLSSGLGVQILMVTHSERLACGKVVRIGGFDE